MKPLSVYMLLASYPRHQPDRVSAGRTAKALRDPGSSQHRRRRSPGRRRRSTRICGPSPLRRRSNRCLSRRALCRRRVRERISAVQSRRPSRSLHTGAARRRPQSRQLVLALDDVSAHDARRNLEVLVNDRTLRPSRSTARARAATSAFRSQREAARRLPQALVPLFRRRHARSLHRRALRRRQPDGAAGNRRRVRYRLAGPLDIATTAALLPHNVAIVLSSRTPSPADIATALTIARSLSVTGRRVTFHHGLTRCPIWRSAKTSGAGRAASSWSAPRRDRRRLDDPRPRRWPGTDRSHRGTLAAARIGGAPALLVSDAGVGARRTPARQSFARRRARVAAASVGQAPRQSAPGDRVTFDQLGLAPAQAEVFGRADLTLVDSDRTLPAGTRPSRLVLDVMVAPDGAGEKAVVSVFVNERLLGSAVAAIGEPTHFDLRAARRPGRHRGERPRRGAAPQRARRLPVRAAGLSGPDPRLERARARDRRTRGA